MAEVVLFAHSKVAHNIARVTYIACGNPSSIESQGCILSVSAQLIEKNAVADDLAKRVFMDKVNF
jgi:hypothetical protein